MKRHTAFINKGNGKHDDPGNTFPDKVIGGIQAESFCRRQTRSFICKPVSGIERASVGSHKQADGKAVPAG